MFLQLGEDRVLLPHAEVDIAAELNPQRIEVRIGLLDGGAVNAVEERHFQGRQPGGECSGGGESGEDVLLKLFDEGECAGAWAAVSDGSAVKLNDRLDVFGGQGHEEFIHLGGLLGGDGFFDGGQACVACDLQDGGACDGWEDFRAEGVCVEGFFAAVDGEEGRAGPFGDEVFVVDEDGFFAAFAVGFNPCEDVGQQIEGFDVAAFPSQVGVSADADAGQFFLGVVPQFLDGEEE